MQVDAQNTAVIDENVATTDSTEGVIDMEQSASAAAEEKTKAKAKKKPRKPPEREEVRLSESTSRLLSKEGFALYVGKTTDAIVSMAKANKLPAIYMADPLSPGGNAELYIDREEWDEACKQLVESAPPEWHDWKNRLFLFKPTSGKRKQSAQKAA